MKDTDQFGASSRWGDEVRLTLEINRALMNKDADRVIASVIAYMERHGLKADAETVSLIPVASTVRAAATNDA